MKRIKTCFKSHSGDKILWGGFFVVCAKINS
nr:MAG TPA: hypothetical protein [Caudoviricetes sp.]